jgi:hypothetical protein
VEGLGGGWHLLHISVQKINISKIPETVKDVTDALCFCCYLWRMSKDKLAFINHIWNNKFLIRYNNPVL